MKPLRTAVEGSRKRRIYDAPATPFERLRAYPGVLFVEATYCHLF